MLRVATRRVLVTVPTLLGVMLVALLLIELMPGDPASIMAGNDATPEAVASIREQLNLDQSFVDRFVDYVIDAVQLDLGVSPASPQPVWDRIWNALPITFSLALWAMTIALVLGVGSGVLAAMRQGRFLDRAVTGATSLLLAVPSFVVGLGLVIFFAVERSILPATGYQPMSDGLWQWSQHLILPSVALALAPAAELARQTRGAMVDTLEQDYIRASRAKGLARRRIIGKHVAKNAATPVVTVAGLQVARVLGGAIVVERIFGMNGYGSLAVSAVLTRDIVLLQGIVLVGAVFVLLTNVLVDLSYGYLNPQVRT